MARLLISLCLLLPAALLVKMVIVTSFDEQVVLHHAVDPDPNREKYIWNPFPGFCGDNATIKRCAGVCPETCAFKSQKCASFCGVNCVCKPNYVFDENSQLCILRGECPQGVMQQVVETHRVFQ